jgi:hypothetical protein
MNFYFGVLHPFARTLSRLLEEPSLATTIQAVYLYFFLRYMFLPSMAFFRNTQLFSGSYLTTTDPVFLCYRSYLIIQKQRIRCE